MISTLLNTLFSIALAQSASSSPVGFWKTIDDSSKKEKAIVEIAQVNDQLEGRIVYIFPDPSKPANPKCEPCPPPFKDQPVLGLKFLWGLKKSNSSQKWDSGEILDPNNGKIYSSKIHLIEDGKKLEVRGFLGFSLLGRTQTWIRTDKATP